MKNNWFQASQDVEAGFEQKSNYQHNFTSPRLCFASTKNLACNYVWRFIVKPNGSLQQQSFKHMLSLHTSSWAFFVCKAHKIIPSYTLWIVYKNASHIFSTFYNLGFCVDFLVHTEIKFLFPQEFLSKHALIIIYKCIRII